jgi:hypothetical protein
MSFLGNLLSGSQGMGWKASGTNIAQPTTTAQANTAYDQTQQGLQNQQAFLQALQGQGGLGNQSNVFGQQQNLANMMQGVAAGTGPNPALAQLNQTTGQNIAATTAALAGARGAGSNPALMARTAARQGADIQQQAAGQGATLAAQQQIAGMDALSRQQQQMASLANQQVANQAAATNAYSSAAQNQQQNLLASINAQNQANVAMQSNINNANAQIQGQTAGGQQGFLGGLLGAAGQGIGLLASAGGTAAGLANPITLPASLATGMVAATGGRVKRDQIGHNPRGLVAMAEGGTPPSSEVARTNTPRIDDKSIDIDVGTPESQSGAAAIQKGLTQFGKGVADNFKKPPVDPSLTRLGTNYRSFPKEPGYQSEMVQGTQTPPSGRTSYPAQAFQKMYQNEAEYNADPNPGYRTYGYAEGGKVPALVSPGEKYLSPEQAQDVLKGKENPMNGKTIPGKAKVKGDSYANDTVPVTLEEGGCVIPRSVLQSDQPMKNAIKFVHAHMKKMAKGGKVENEKKDQKAEKQPAAESHQVPMAVASEVLKNPHMLFSPANALFKKTLDLTPDQVLGLLHSKGIVAEPAMGKYGEVEPSIVVHNVEHHHVPFILDLAKQLGQESAIMSANGKHEAHYLNGPNEGKVARGMGTVIHGKEPDNFYTKTKNGLIFSHNIDWDNLHDK